MRIAVLVGVLVLIAAPASAISCEVDGAHGFVTIDGSCMTLSRYTELFSYENLATVPNVGNDPRFETVADIIDVNGQAKDPLARRAGVNDDGGSMAEYLFSQGLMS